MQVHIRKNLKRIHIHGKDYSIIVLNVAVNGGESTYCYKIAWKVISSERILCEKLFVLLMQNQNF